MEWLTKMVSSTDVGSNDDADDILAVDGGLSLAATTEEEEVVPTETTPLASSPPPPGGRVARGMVADDPLGPTTTTTTTGPSSSSSADDSAAEEEEGGSDDDDDDGADSASFDPDDDDSSSSSSSSDEDDSFGAFDATWSSSSHALEPPKRALSLREKAELFDETSKACEELTSKLEALGTDDEEETHEFLRESLNISRHKLDLGSLTPLEGGEKTIEEEEEELRKERSVWSILGAMVLVLLGVVGCVGATFALGEYVVGPPRQPVGPYRLVELQEGEAFFDYYNFYEGRDSAGSNGYNMYVSEERARALGIVNVTRRANLDDVFFEDGGSGGGGNGTTSSFFDDDEEEGDGGGDGFDEERRGTRGTTTTEEGGETSSSAASSSSSSTASDRDDDQPTSPLEDRDSYVYMGSAPTESGPRDSIRLEGKRRFNRGLFVVDLRHMPAGCGVWPAFWLTDEANWPVNGEIDIVEGVNYQSVAKTALHSTKGCTMDDVPAGTKTGTWDTAVGIPDRKTGIPDMTMRYASDCFVYDPHQWLNQGCVAVDLEGNTLGQPLNEKGGGVYALEWDPINRHIRTWVFSPHGRVPPNLRDAIHTAGREEKIMPDPDEWGLPYGYFPVGDETSCPSSHFRNMRLVFNLAFCGSVAGNRYFMDCPSQFKEIKTCNAYVKSRPKELEEEAHWKIRGVYVYEREWEREWV